MAEAHSVIFNEDHGLTLTVIAYKKTDSTVNYTAATVTENATENCKYVAAFTNLPAGDYSVLVKNGSTPSSKFTITGVEAAADPVWDDSLVPASAAAIVDAFTAAGGVVNIFSQLDGDSLTLSTVSDASITFVKPSGADWPSDLTGMVIEFHVRIGTNDDLKLGTMSVVTATGSSQSVLLTLTAAQAYAMKALLPTGYVNVGGNATNSSLGASGLYAVHAMSSDCTVNKTIYGGALTVVDSPLDNSHTHCVLS